MAGALFHAPELVTGAGVISIESFGTLAKEGRDTLKGRDMTGGKSFPKIAFRLHPAIGIKVLVIHRPVFLPHGSPGLFIQSNDELMVAAVKIHDQQVLINNRRRTCTSVMIAL